MRVLTLNYEYPPIGGGGSPVTHALARELANLGHDIHVVTMAYGDLPAECDMDGVHVHRVPCRRLRPDICTTREMATYLAPAYRKARELAGVAPFDLLHCHFIFPTGVAAALLKRALKIPLLINCHGSDVPGYNPHRFKFEHRLLVPLWHWVVRHVDGFAFPSDSLRDMFRAAVPNAAQPCRVIRYGVDSGRFVAGDKVPGQVLMVGRLLERKGFRTMLEALKLQPLPLTLHIVGDGPDRELLEQMAKGLETPVVFHGWLDNDSPELEQLYAESSIFVFPSAMESFGLVLLEAMAAGLAVLSSDAGGCRAALGDAGEYIPVGDPAALARQLGALLADPDRVVAMGATARQRVEQEFGWPGVGRQYQEYYAELLAAHGQGR